MCSWAGSWRIVGHAEAGTGKPGRPAQAALQPPISGAQKRTRHAALGADDDKYPLNVGLHAQQLLQHHAAHKARAARQQQRGPAEGRAHAQPPIKKRRRCQRQRARRHCDAVHLLGRARRARHLGALGCAPIPAGPPAAHQQRRALVAAACAKVARWREARQPEASWQHCRQDTWRPHQWGERARSLVLRAGLETCSAPVASIA